MAKRKKREEEEDEEEFDFEVPEFDRVEYMKDEIRKGKSILISVAIAPIFSFVALQLFLLIGDWRLAMIGGLTGLVLIPPVLRTLNVDTDQLGKKEWATDAAMFFFTFLAIWVILMNPPVNDFAHPTVNDIEVEVQDPETGEWVELSDANITNGEEYNITIRAKITDNVEVEDDELEARIIPPNDSQYRDLNKEEDNHYTIIFKNVEAPDNYKISFEVEDVNGNSATLTKSFSLDTSE
ncbi:MAG: hypothetical protein ACOCZJ_02145 [Thermoplasmatota archaeon]